MLRLVRRGKGLGGTLKDKLRDEKRFWGSISSDKWNSIIPGSENGYSLKDNTVNTTGEKFTVKDNILTKGTTTCGSKMLESFQSPTDATVVKLLTEKNYNLVGKNNLDEFGMGSFNLNSIFGPAVNPLFSEEPHVTGGSSGGSAASVAAGLCDFSLGTDTGGSVRFPASNCGIYGFKPSYGRISRWGVIPYAQTLDTVGILAAKLHTLTSVFAAIDKYDKKDPTCLSISARDEIDQLTTQRDLSRNHYVFGIPEELMVGELTELVRNKLGNLAANLIDEGHEIVLVSIPSLKTLLLAYYTIATAEAASNLSRYDGIRYGYGESNDVSDNRTRGLGTEVQRRIILGNYSLSSQAGDHYSRATDIRRQVVKEFNEIFHLPNVLMSSESTLRDPTLCDFLLVPTSINEPATIKETVELEQQNVLVSYTNDILTTPMSLAGLPSISLPIKDPGYEISTQGIQLIGQFGDDEKVLEVSEHIMNL